MALIYASAVNKRLNSHEARCKRSTVEPPHCGLQEISRSSRQHSSDDPHDVAGLTDMTRSISLNKDLSIQRKRSGSQQSTASGISVCLVQSLYCDSPLLYFRPSHSDIKRKTTVPGNGNCGERATRKVSTPAMMHSAVQNPCPGSHNQKQSMRKNLIKKRLIQQYGLENSLDSTKSNGPMEHSFDNRRKSQSLDPDDWKRHVALASGEDDDDETSPRSSGERKLSAFKRMRNRFAKWRHPRLDADS
uniref:Uncharacterized protein n=1 Tax=Panagrellus redivivus TaxID=6233 RepID=A0A7E4VJG3_PANRE